MDADMPEPRDRSGREKLIEEYGHFMDGLVSVGRVVSEMPLDKMLRTVRHAETAGPILQPSKYKKAMKGLKRQQRLIEAAVKFRRVYREVQSEVLAEHTERKERNGDGST